MIQALLKALPLLRPEYAAKLVGVNGFTGRGSIGYSPSKTARANYLFNSTALPVAKLNSLLITHRQRPSRLKRATQAQFLPPTMAINCPT